MVLGISLHVGDRLVVLVFGFDHPRPEAAAEDVVAALVALVEVPCVAAVQVSHPVGEVRARGLHDEVVVVSHQAAHVQAPAVAPLHAAEDVEERLPVGVVEGDRGAVVSLRHDVVVRAGGEVAVVSAHRNDGSPALRRQMAAAQFRYATGADGSRARHATCPAET